MDYFAFFVAFGVLLITALAMNVSRVRIKIQVGNGDGDNPLLKKAIRAHMNTIEHLVPYSLVLFSLVHVGINTIYLAIFTVGFLTVRLVHTYGMLWSNFKVRKISAGLSYLFELSACIALLLNLVVV